jgi:hypothetical protein
MTNNFKALGSKVIGILIDNYGIKKTSSGLYINDVDGSAEAVRPRWFKITHVGPDQKDVGVGDYVLVSHGRWSRGFFISTTDEQKYFHLDEDEILIVTDQLPKEFS